MKKSYLLLVLLTFLCINAYGQSPTCAGADPFCAGGSALTFPNVTNQPAAEAGIDYDCLFTQPNPAWFYLQVSIAGDLSFQISQVNNGGAGIDVDFIAWGPFATPICGAANLNAGTQVACSYSAAPIENFTISNAQVGEVYMLLITNFSNQAGQISLTQTNSGSTGAGATDCNIICPLSILGAAPPCPQTTLTAQYLNATAPTFQWYNTSGAIAGATGSTYTTSVPGDYTVVANSPGCYANASATVTIPPPVLAPTTQNPVTLNECGPAPAFFDLTQNDEAFMGLDPNDYTINGYYTDPTNAGLGISPIGSPTNYSGADGQTIYLAIEDNNGGCITVLSFTLDIIDCGPIPPPTQAVCDDISNNGTEVFDLDALIPGILGTHSAADYTVTFHTSQTNADNDVADVLPTNAYVGGPNQTIFIRMEENATGLFGTTSFLLVVHPQPATPNPADVTVCDSYILPVLPAGQTYHAGSATGPVIANGSNITTTQTIFIVAESGTTPNCTASGDFLVTVNVTPTAPNPADVTACDSYVLPALPSPTQSYHAGTATGPVIAAGTAITTTQTIVIVDETGTTPNCSSSGDFIVTINTTPVAPNPADVTVCDSYVLPALPSPTQSYHAGTATGPVIAAGTAITTTQTIVIVDETGTTPNCSSSGDFLVTVNVTPTAPNPADVTACDSYVLPALPSPTQTYHAGTATGAIIPAGTVITTTQTIVIVDETGTTPNCSSNGDFLVTINTTPATPNPADVTVCDSYVLPALPSPTQSYHAGTATGPVIAAGTAITTTQTIVIVDETGTTPNCSASGDFLVTVNVTPTAPNPADVTACDSYMLPALPSPTQTYHAGTATGAIIPAGTVITTTQTIVIVDETGTTPNCSSSGDFIVTINTTPVAPNPADVTACDSYVLPALPSPTQSYHAGTATGPVIAAGTAITTTQTIVIVDETGTTPNCSASGDFLVTVNVTPTAPNPADVTACDSYVLPALPSPTQSYHAGTATGPVIAAGTVITTTQTIVIVDETGTTPNCSSNGDFLVTINTTPATPNPADVTVCDSYVLPALPSPTQSYHAGTATGPVIAAGTAITTTQTIVIVDETGTTPNCSASGDFLVTVNVTPTAPNPADVTACDSYVLPALPSPTQTYHAGTATGAIIPAGTVITTTQTIVIVDETGTTPNCSSNGDFLVTINTTPTAPNPADVTVCDSYVLPALPSPTQSYHAGTATGPVIAAGTAITTTQTIVIVDETGTTPNCSSSGDFLVTVNVTPIADAPSNVTACDSYVLPALNSGSYYSGPGGTGTSYVAGDVITSSMTMYVFAQTGTVPNCTDEHSFTISIFYSPVALPAADIHVCDDNNDGFSCLFDLTPAIAQVTGGNAALSVSFHETATDAQTGANPITTSSAYCNIVASSQTIHIRVFDPAAPQCSSQQTVDIFVDPVPVPNPVIPDYRLCDYNAPGDGQESFDLTTMDGVILNGQTGITVTYYDNNADAVLGTNAIPTPTAYTNTVSPQQICARLTNDTSGCFAVACFNLVVDPLPAVFASAMNACGDATGISIFDLASQSLTVSGGVPGLGVSYYLTQAGAQAGDATAASYIADPVNFQNTANPQVVYASVRNLATGCISVAPVTLTVSQGPAAAVPQRLEVCDPNNDCFAPFDLTLSISDILGSPVPPAGITVTFHETLTDAQNGQTPIATPGSYTNIVACDQVVYVSVAFDATGCRTVVELPIHVNLTPQATEIDALEVCDDDTDGIGTFDLDAAIADILGGLSPAGHTVGFYLTQSDAQTPTGQITNVLGFHNTTPGTQTIWVRVEDNATGCFDVISLDLIVNPKPLLPPTPTGAALPYSKCDYNNPGDEREEFDLQSQIPGILNGQTGITVTFHETQAQALASSGALASPYINTANAQTLWVRMEDQLTGCWVLTTMDLRVEPLPELVPPLAADLTQCDADGDGFGQFALTALVPDMLQGAPGITVSFHETLADAQGGGNALASPYQNIVAFLQPLYVRAENTLTGCWSVMMIELRVIPSPVVPPLDDLTQCDTDANDQDGLSVFDLTGQEQLILNSQVGPAAGYVVSYHTSQADAQQGIGPIVGATAYANTSNPQTIWVRVEGITGGCANVGSFDVEVTVPLALTTPSQLSICDDGPTSALPQAVFDLTLKDNEITGGAPGYTVSYYETQADALADTDAIADPGAYTNIANAQTLFVAVKGPAPTFCRSFTTLTIRVLPIPVPLTADIPVLEACDDNAPVGTELFDLTQNESYIRDNDPQLGFGYYTTLAAAQAGDTTSADYIATPTAFEAGTGTIYIRVERTSEADYQGDFCYVIVEQPVVVNPLPALVAADAVGCDSSGTGSLTYGYTLSDYNAILLAPGQDVADFTFAHYLSLADAQGGVGQLPDGYTGSDGQVLTVKVTNIDTGCIAYVELTLRVSAGAGAANATAAAVCDTDSDGLMDVDLTQFDTTVLGGQAPAQFSVAYFATMADALAGTGALTSPYNMSSGTLYAVVTNNNTGCRSTVATVGVSIEPLVDIDITSATSDGISNSICVDFVTGALISGLTLESGLPDDGTYSFQWSLGGADIAGATASTYTINDATGFGDYAVRATTALGCVSVSDAFTVVQAGPASIAAGTSGYTVSNAFAQDQTIIVTVQGYGTYHYQLDDGPILDNGGIFTDVPPGIHTVTVYDMEGDGAEHCDSITIGGIQTIDYPRFFTPNGDGINDTWNISGIDQFAKIFIYDRYGKLLKQISPTGTGWDGTFNGQPLPSTDYWFTVEYPEMSTQTLPVMKEFRAHFSLKR